MLEKEVSQDINQTLLSAPLYLVWEINRLCNAKCLHCYSDSGPDANETGILTAEELRHIAQQLIDAKVIHVGISGGEPLLRDECIEIVSLLSSGGIFVSLATNGKILSPALARNLKKAGLDSVTLSLDSHTPELHNWIRGSKGLFEAANRGIDYLQDAGFDIVVGITAMKYNFAELDAMCEYLVNRNITSLNITGFVPVGRGKPEHGLTGEQLRSFLDTAIALGKRLEGKLAIMWHDCRFALLDKQFSDFSFKGCGAGNTTARITYDGKVTPCSTLPIVSGDLRRQLFSDIWKNSKHLQEIRDRKNIRPDSNCGRCGHVSACGGCRSISYGYSNDPWGDNPHCWLESESITA